MVIRPARQSPLIILVIAAAFAASAPAKLIAGTQSNAGSRLVAAYPDHLDRVEGNDLIWRDGRRMQIDDGRGQKSFEDLLNTPDIDDIFAIPYTVGKPATVPAVNQDPGRARPAAFYDKMYSDCRKGGVKPNLVEITWLPKKSGEKLQVTQINGVAGKLQAVSAELDDLPAEFDIYLKPAAGTYNCRVIAGTDRVSTHGHGIAIDIAIKRAHYWRWSKAAPDGGYPYRNEIPLEIVQIFEKHGFIWGGKWYHYDTMHFEYRPELLEK